MWTSGLITGIMISAAIVMVGAVIFRHRRNKQPAIQIYSTIEELRSVGELVVFKVITKEIVTTADHWFGEWGKKYFRWLASNKKMALIFEFELNFTYNLRSNDFDIDSKGENQYHLKMPRCCYEIYIRDVSFYDEQTAKLLPWLLPEIVSKAFGSGFDETDRNRLKEEARQQAVIIAENFVKKMSSEVQTSARQTLEALAKAFGAEKVTIDFRDTEPVQTRVESADLGKTKPADDARTLPGQ